MNILDQYVIAAPSAQNALDIMAGSWVSKLPEPLTDLQSGTIPLFEDARVAWADEQLGKFKGRTVLELGSLEGAHTYQMDRLGAVAILAIESNTSAYLRSLIVKELLDIKRARFACGDFVAYMRNNQKTFDVCFASGVLYHMRNPAELIALIARTTDRVFIWAHYYDYAIISRRPDFRSRFPDIPPQPSEHQGFKHTLYRQQYQSEIDWPGFSGGNAPYSQWMTRDDILACLRYFGFDDLRISFDDPDHFGGPSFAIAAIRSRPNGYAELNNAEAIIAQEIVADDPASEDERTSALLDASFTRPPINKPLELLQNATVQRQNRHTEMLEAEIQRKNEHITQLEALIKQIEDGRVMRLLRLLKQ